MIGSHDPNPLVIEQGCRTHLGGGLRVNHAGFKIHLTVAQRRAIFVGLGQELQDHARGLDLNPRKQIRAKGFHKAFTGAQGKAPLQSAKIKLVGRAQQGIGPFDQGPDLRAQLDGAGCGHKAAPCPHQQRISRNLAQAGQSAAHRRGA